MFIQVGFLPRECAYAGRVAVTGQRGFIGKLERGCTREGQGQRKIQDGKQHRSNGDPAHEGGGQDVFIALACLLEEAGIPYLFMDQSVAPRQESGNFFGWLTIRVPRERESEAREILESVEEAK